MSYELIEGLVCLCERRLFKKKQTAEGQLTHWVIHFHAALHTDGARHCVFYQLVQRLCERDGKQTRRICV